MSKVHPKKLVYRDHVYHLARSTDDIIWEEVSDLAKEIHTVASSEDLDNEQKKLRASDAYGALREVLKRVLPI